MSRRQRVGLVLGLGALLVLPSAWWLPALGRFLVVSDPLAPADAILPLAGDPTRAAYAADLFARGLARWYLITPLPLATPAAQAKYVATTLAIARRRGVPEEAILVVPQAGASTFEEARNVRAFLQGRDDVASLLVVTSPWHTRRARMLFRLVFRADDPRISVQPVRDEGRGYLSGRYQPAAWWTNPRWRDATLSEYAKLFANLVGVR